MKHTMKRINKQSAWEVTYENGAQFLQSYSTPVAGYIPGLGFIETDRKWSVTTSKHITQWKKRMGYPLTARVPQEELNNWLQKLDGLKMEEAQ
jgi:hypothetical protein